MFRIFLLLLAVAIDSNAQLPGGINNPYYSPVVETQTIAVTRFNNFDLELLREFERTRSNVFLSPTSIKTTLSMILEGANGNSADEISRVIGIPKGIASDKLSSLVHILSGGTNGTIITSSSGIFVSDRRQVPLSYANTIADNYSGFIKLLDFSNAHASAQEVNSWVKKETGGLINTLVTPDHFRSEVTAVIANALYFKGIWKKTFDPLRTSEKYFRTPTNNRQPVEMMQNIETYNYRYFSDIDTDIIELPYSDNVYSMYILLPRRNDVDIMLRDLGSSLTGRLGELRETQIQIELPKFSIEFETDLAAPLQNLGIKDIFRQSANLTGIVKDGELYVSNMIHKAKIEVDERGTVAAGASGAIVIPLIGTARPKIVVDHPFAFFIYNTQLHTTLFEGIVYDPNVNGNLKQRSQNEQHQYQYPNIYKPPRF